MGSRLEHVIARNITELRDENGWTQAQLAEEMRSRGFTWATNRAAQIETLRRPVSLLEFVFLSLVFQVPVERLLRPADGREGDSREMVTLPDGSTCRLVFLKQVLSGDTEPDHRQLLSAVARNPTDSDDLRKMAAKLGLNHVELASVAQHIFRRSFQDERDTRLGDVSDLTKRSAQTKRGHVSRAMLAEIADYLGEGQQRADRLDEIRRARAARFIERHVTEGGGKP